MEATSITHKNKESMELEVILKDGKLESVYFIVQSRERGITDLRHLSSSNFLESWSSFFYILDLP